MLLGLAHCSNDGGASGGSSVQLAAAATRPARRVQMGDVMCRSHMQCTCCVSLSALLQQTGGDI